MADLPDVGQQMAQWAARMQAGAGGGDDKGWASKTINPYAKNLTPTAAAPGKGQVPAMFGAGTGGGILGSKGEKWKNAIQQALAAMSEGYFNSLANTGIQAVPVDTSTNISSGLDGGGRGGRYLT